MGEGEADGRDGCQGVVCVGGLDSGAGNIQAYIPYWKRILDHWSMPVDNCALELPDMFCYMTSRSHRYAENQHLQEPPRLFFPSL